MAVLVAPLRLALSQAQARPPSSTRTNNAMPVADLVMSRSSTSSAGFIMGAFLVSAAASESLLLVHQMQSQMMCHWCSRTRRSGALWWRGTVILQASKALTGLKLFVQPSRLLSRVTSSRRWVRILASPFHRTHAYLKDLKFLVLIKFQTQHNNTWLVVNIAQWYSLHFRFWYCKCKTNTMGETLNNWVSALYLLGIRFTMISRGETMDESFVHVLCCFYVYWGAQ